MLTCSCGACGCLLFRVPLRPWRALRLMGWAAARRRADAHVQAHAQGPARGLHAGERVHGDCDRHPLRHRQGGPADVGGRPGACARQRRACSSPYALGWACRLDLEAHAVERSLAAAAVFLERGWRCVRAVLGGGVSGWSVRRGCAASGRLCEAGAVRMSAGRQPARQCKGHRPMASWWGCCSQIAVAIWRKRCQLPSSPAQSVPVCMHHPVALMICLAAS